MIWSPVILIRSREWLWNSVCVFSRRGSRFLNNEMFYAGISLCWLVAGVYKFDDDERFSVSPNSSLEWYKALLCLRAVWMAGFALTQLFLVWLLSLLGNTTIIIWPRRRHTNVKWLLEERSSTSERQTHTHNSNTKPTIIYSRHFAYLSWISQPFAMWSWSAEHHTELICFKLSFGGYFGLDLVIYWEKQMSHWNK